MKISFLVTAHNEGKQLFNLLTLLKQYVKSDNDNEVVVLDDYSDDQYTKSVLSDFSKEENFEIYYHHLNKNYGEHKNYGNNKCKGDYIFQLDADELITPLLLLNLKEIIKENPVDLFHFPRINIVHGLTEEHVKMFGWRLTPIDGINAPVINAPDFQSRLYKKDPSIRWERKLHEHIQGHSSSTFIPTMIGFCLIHEKTIDRQIKQNEFYMKNFSLSDNVRM